MNRSVGFVCIAHLSVEDWKSVVSRSNQAAMQKIHKYPRYEGAFLTKYCTFQKSICHSSCFCKNVGCKGVWTLRSDLKFETFLSFFVDLWVRGSDDFRHKVQDSAFPVTGRMARRMANGIRLLRQIKGRWSNWDGNGNSLPSLVSKVRHCYFCDDSFEKMMPIVRIIIDISPDSTGMYTSKLISQLFYDIAIPFDTESRKRQGRCGYTPEFCGDGTMREQAKSWLLANRKSIDDFRGLDDAPTSCWYSEDRERNKNIGTACSRVLDKLFY